MEAQVTISRPGTDLDLEDPGKFELVSIAMAGRSWRRYTVEGRYQHGRAFIGAVLDTATLVVVVRVLGASWSAVNTRRVALFDALAQPAYEVAVAVEGVTETWTAEPADITGGLDKFQAMASRQEYTLQIPVYPLSVPSSEPT
ncbi:MAG: hypothetical protein NVV70_16775 [Cellulomonas sp.]|nr:hypothetical protein [Cellulomonas sp.]MCR6649700.1 hypothetical protein [Cellulomonas sp.]